MICTSPRPAGGLARNRSHSHLNRLRARKRGQNLALCRVLTFASKISENGGHAVVQASDPKIGTSFVSKFNYGNDVRFSRAEPPTRASWSAASRPLHRVQGFEHVLMAAIEDDIAGAMCV
jgi:hypothetical protein